MQIVREFYQINAVKNLRLPEASCSHSHAVRSFYPSVNYTFLHHGIWVTDFLGKLMEVPTTSQRGITVRELEKEVGGVATSN